MADNNINGKWPWPVGGAQLGTFPEEVKELQKRLEKNPDAAPMPELGPTKLLTPSRSSDNLRIGEPPSIEAVNETVAVNFWHVVIRRFLIRSKKKAVIDFERAVETEDLGDLPASRRDQMRSMLARERAMLDMLARYNALAELVYLRLLSESKG